MSDARYVLALDRDAVEALLAEHFPQLGERFEILVLEPRRAVVAMQAGFDALRPGGTVSGPALFGLADLAAYVATMGLIGPETLTVTSSAEIQFLRKPRPGRLLAEARVLKLGRRLAVSDVLVRSEGDEEPVVHASVTYAIP